MGSKEQNFGEVIYLKMLQKKNDINVLKEALIKIEEIQKEVA